MNNSLSLTELLKIYGLLYKNIFKRKNKLILLGAGAVIDIGGPFTICNGSNISKNCCLTHLVLSCGPMIKPHTRITTAIYQELNNYIPNPNFEDIIDFLENSIVSISYPKHFSYSTYYQFLINNLNIVIESDTVSINSFPTHNIKAKDLPNAYFIILQNVLVEIINSIRERVRQYEQANNSGFDNNFLNWFNNQVLSKYKAVNIYSLNYDAYLFNLISKSNNKINLAKPDKSQLRKSINYYNLHGSINWKISKTANKKSYQIDYSDNLETTDIQMTDLADKFTLLSPIITGRDKVNKIFAKPFQDFVNCFNNDTLSADEIYIIGYSFLDNHINSVLRKALEKNPKAKIVVVNPGLNIPDFVNHIFDDLKFSTDKKNKYTIFNPLNNSFEIEGSNMRHFMCKFIDYLVNPHNTKQLINADIPLFEQLKQRLE